MSIISNDQDIYVTQISNNKIINSFGIPFEHLNTTNIDSQTSTTVTSFIKLFRQQNIQQILGEVGSHTIHDKYIWCLGLSPAFCEMEVAKFNWIDS